MRVVIAFALLLFAAPLARADGSPPEKEPLPTIAQTEVETEAPAQPQMVLTEAKLPEHNAAAAEAVADQDMPRRGSFWWLVGVIVVAGVVLAVLLD